MAWNKIKSEKELKTGDRYSPRFTIGEKIKTAEELVTYINSCYEKRNKREGELFERVSSVYMADILRPISISYLYKYSFSTIMNKLKSGIYYLVPDPEHPKNKIYI